MANANIPEMATKWNFPIYFKTWKWDFYESQRERERFYNNNNDDRPIFFMVAVITTTAWWKKDLPKYDINNSNDKGENWGKREHFFINLFV